MTSRPTIHRPRSESEVTEIVMDARAAKTPLAIEGGNTRAGLGRPMQAPVTLSTSALSGITIYEPAEMVISARAGTPVSEIERAIGEKGQMLPFEPMDHRALYGSAGDPTIGAVAACNISGPRRIAAGAARDHLIGLRIVNGRAEAVKSGGRVMKNVTGLDLVKLVCGSHGTLGVITEVTFKLLPKPRGSGTLVVEGLDDERAVACMSAALGSPFEISGAAHLPPGLWGESARTVLRLEHFPDSVHYRLNALEKLLAAFGPMARLDHEPSLNFWRDLRDVGPLVRPSESAVWRISVAPTRAPRLMRAIREAVQGDCFYDWGGGLVWFATPAQADCGAGAIRRALGATGGHATLTRAPDSMRAALDVFEPLTPALMKLTRGVKLSFDPQGLFNPGRLPGGT